MDFARLTGSMDEYALIGVDKPRRLRRVQMTPELLADLFADGNWINAEIKKGLPDDAAVVEVFTQRHPHTLINLIVESDRFDLVEDGAVIPTAEVEIARHFLRAKALESRDEVLIENVPAPEGSAYLEDDVVIPLEELHKHSIVNC